MACPGYRQAQAGTGGHGRTLQVPWLAIMHSIITHTDRGDGWSASTLPSLVPRYGLPSPPTTLARPTPPSHRACIDIQSGPEHEPGRLGRPPDEGKKWPDTRVAGMTIHGDNKVVDDSRQQKHGAGKPLQQEGMSTHGAGHGGSFQNSSPVLLAVDHRSAPRTSPFAPPTRQSPRRRQRRRRCDAALLKHGNHCTRRPKVKQRCEEAMTELSPRGPFGEMQWSGSTSPPPGTAKNGQEQPRADVDVLRKPHMFFSAPPP